MQQNSLTYARILESQGFVTEAFEVYKNLLSHYPNNTEIKNALKRLKKLRGRFGGVNVRMRNFFIQMDTEAQFMEFENWLIKGNKINE
jgi:outer membrane protein assembly factor BamD (BamD/ComL family)